MKTQSLAVIAAVVLMCVIMASPSLAGDNGNGTVTVNGLVWLKDAGCLGAMNGDAAKNRAASLANGQCGLADKSTAGQWRLPTIEELKGIYSAKGGFSNVQASDYWSGTTYANNTDYAWVLHMRNGYTYSINKSYNFTYVWPVRSGQ